MTRLIRMLVRGYSCCPCCKRDHGGDHATKCPNGCHGF